MNHYVYVLQLWGYSNTPHCKIGVSKNPLERAYNLFRCGGLISELVGFFCYPDRQSAFDAETSVKRQFKKYRTRYLRSTEIFDFSHDNLISFLRLRDPAIEFTRVQ